MNGRWRRQLHRCARALGWVAGSVVIVLAVLMALAQLLLPLLARHPDWIAAQLSQRLHRPVSFSSMQGSWTGSGPLFAMHGVTVGAAPGESGAALKVPEADLKLDFGSWLLPSRHLLSLRVRDLQVNLTHEVDGRWQVNGIGVAGQGAQQQVSLGRLSLDLRLENLHVLVDDKVLGKQFVLLAPQLRLSRQGQHIRFGGSVQRNGVATRLHAVGRFRDDGSSGRLWLGADDLQLQPLLAGVDTSGYVAEHGRGQVAAWLDWRKGHLYRALVHFDLTQVRVLAPDGAVASAPALQGTAGLSADGAGYLLRWAGNDGSALVARLQRPGSAEATIGLAGRDLQLTPLLPWLALKPGLQPALSRWLGSGHPHGRLAQVSLQWSKTAGVSALAVSFDQLGVDAVGKLPGIDHLAGELRGDGEAFSLQLPNQAVTVRAPQLFRQPLTLSNVGGTLALWSQDGHWHIGADTLDFAGAGYAGSARGEVSLPAAGGAPTVDLYANIDHADVAAAKLFWPLNSMSPGTIHWLDRALVSGHIDQAQVVLRGDLANWPFRLNTGRFEARAAISDLKLDYGTGWPVAEGVDATASFINNGLLVQLGAGQVLGVKLDHAVALIPDFADGVLDLNASGSGSGASLMNFVRKSPIGAEQADTLAKLDLGGSGSFALHLILPLGHPQDAQLDGTAQLQQADLNAPDFNLQLGQLSGPLQFNLHGLRAGPLSTVVHGQPASLQMAIAGANADPEVTLSAQLQGAWSFAELVQNYPSLAWLGQASDGRSEFDIGFAIRRAAAGGATTQQLSVDSSLAGMRLDLPTPLAKPAAEDLPLHLTMSLPVSNSDLQVSLGKTLNARFRLPASPAQGLAGTLAFGGAMPTVLPSKGLRIGGHVDALDVTGWVQRTVAGAGGDGPGLESIDVGTDQAMFFGSDFGAMQIRARPLAGALSLNVTGAAMNGTFSVPTVDLDKRGITARLQRLYWPKDQADETTGTAGKPGKESQANMPAGKPPVQQVRNAADTGISPSALPPFHLLVDDLRLGDAKLGEARLETWPTPDGLHIEQLRALSSQVQINGTGDWRGSASSSHTHMRIAFSAEDLGAMLSAFGYEGLVHGGKTHDQLDASWPGAPSSLSLADMSGTLDVHVQDGRIPEAAPGVGRLLGLVSLAELPRRLTLDFGDVFGKGLGFDSIQGEFKLANGNATTSDLEIKGAAANISITGRTGLRSHDFDQQVVVVPHVGNSLPLVGAVVGGPIGAAAGFAVQGLLGKGLNKTASARYTVTGSWSKPKMTLVEKHGVLKPPVVPPLAPAAGSTAPAAASSSAL